MSNKLKLKCKSGASGSLQHARQTMTNGKRVHFFFRKERRRTAHPYIKVEGKKRAVKTQVQSTPYGGQKQTYTNIRAHCCTNTTSS
jgi:hypothetical protein